MLKADQKFIDRSMGSAACVQAPRSLILCLSMLLRGVQRPPLKVERQSRRSGPQAAHGRLRGSSDRLDRWTGRSVRRRRPSLTLSARPRRPSVDQHSFNAFKPLNQLTFNSKGIKVQLNGASTEGQAWTDLWIKRSGLGQGRRMSGEAYKNHSRTRFALKVLL